MNKKKIFFLAILWFFVLIIVLIVSFINWWEKTDIWNKTSGNFKIWILNDSVDDFSLYIEDFKKASWVINFAPKIESFDNYDEYNSALASAIIKGEAPDLYMLNNNEKSIFLENAIWIDPEVISPDDLRTYFKPFFWDDLILSTWVDDLKKEFLVWIPFWFETLGLYFNFRRINDVKKLNNFPNIENYITELHDSKPELTALWIWRWTTVENSSDIITQFIMSDQVKDLSMVNSSNIKNVFSEYFNFATWDNNYSQFDISLKQEWKTNLDSFIDEDVGMIFGYPRLLSKIDEKWFSKSTLMVTNFPDFINETEKLVNYNYFVLNKDSQNKQPAYEFMKYIFSEEWEKAYLNHFKYYIPARISVYSDVKDRKISDSFNIKLKDFYNSEAIYSSFDKWLKTVYDKEITILLDDEINYLTNVSRFIESLKCKSSKIIKLEKLSESCE